MRSLLIPAATLALGLAAGPALAAPGFATGDVNLRAGPGTSYPRVIVVPGGAGVEIFGCLQGYSWCDVGFGGTRGWVSSNYLQYLQDQRRVPLPGYAPQSGVPIVTFSFGNYWRDNYRGRPWYAERDRWGGPPPPPRVVYGAPPPPPPGWERRDWREGRADWRDGRREDWREGRREDWRDRPGEWRRDDRRGPEEGRRDGRGPRGRDDQARAEDRPGRGPDDRGPPGRDRAERGPGERGPGDRGPGDRGPGDRGPGERGPRPD